MRMNERHKPNVIEIESLWSMCEGIRIDRLRNEKVRRTFDVRENITDRVDIYFVNSDMWSG